MQSPSDTRMTTPGSVSQEGEREPSGCGLGANVDVLVCRAEWYYHVGAYQVNNMSPSAHLHLETLSMRYHASSLQTGCLSHGAWLLLIEADTCSAELTLVISLSSQVESSPVLTC